MNKKLLFLAAIFLFMASASSAAMAEDAANTSNVGYSGGFFIKNDENTFKLTLNGRLQTKLFWDKYVLNTPPQQISFQIRRALLGVTASIHEKAKLGFVLQHSVVKPGTPSPFATVQVGGATIAYEFIPEFTVTAGMVGLPLDMMGDMSTNWLLLMDPPLTATLDDDTNELQPVRPNFGAPAGLGINFSGGYWKWYYSVSVINAAESNYTLNTNRKVSAGLKTGFNILDAVPGKETDFECSTTPKLTVNVGSIYQGKRTDTNVSASIGYIWTSSLGAALRWAGLAVTTEGYYRKTHMTSPGTGVYNRLNLTDIGYYMGVGYYAIPKKLEIALQGGQIFRQGPQNDAYEMGGGINYYIFDNNLKLQLAYDLLASYNLTGAAPDYDSSTKPSKEHNVALMLSSSF